MDYVLIFLKLKMIYLNKILPHFVYPITALFFLLVWAILSKKRMPAVLALFLLLITSSPIVSDQMVAHLEKQEHKKLLEEISPADSIVVLSGRMVTPIATKHGVVYEWVDPDRFFGGIELFKAGKSNKIIFTGGFLPWQKDFKTEGDILAKYAEDFGLSSSQIIVTKDVQNTLDEVLAVREILARNNANKIILVTSAFHMPRAASLFKKEGIEVQTYPVDFKADIRNLSLIDFLPSADSFSLFQFSLRELIGRAYYGLR